MWYLHTATLWKKIEQALCSGIESDRSTLPPPPPRGFKYRSSGDERELRSWCRLLSPSDPSQSRCFPQSGEAAKTVPHYWRGPIAAVAVATTVYKGLERLASALSHECKPGLLLATLGRHCPCLCGHCVGLSGHSVRFVVPIPASLCLIFLQVYGKKATGATLRSCLSQLLLLEHQPIMLGVSHKRPTCHNTTVARASLL